MASQILFLDLQTFQIPNGLWFSVCSSMELNLANFNLGKALDAVMSQVTALSNENGVQIILDSPPDVCSMHLYGDHLRLQQVLSEFLVNSVTFSPVFEGSSVTFTIIPRKEAFGQKIQVVHLEFRYVSAFSNDYNRDGLTLFTLLHILLLWITR